MVKVPIEEWAGKLETLLESLAARLSAVERRLNEAGKLPSPAPSSPNPAEFEKGKDIFEYGLPKPPATTRVELVLAPPYYIEPKRYDGFELKCPNCNTRWGCGSVKFGSRYLQQGDPCPECNPPRAIDATDIPRATQETVDARQAAASAPSNWTATIGPQTSAPPAPILEWYSEAGFIHCPKCRTIHLLRRDGLGLHPGDPCPRCVPPKPDIPILKRTAFWGDLICSQCKSHFPFTEHESLYHPGDPCPECTKKGGE